MGEAPCINPGHYKIKNPLMFIRAILAWQIEWAGIDAFPAELVRSLIALAKNPDEPTFFKLIDDIRACDFNQVISSVCSSRGHQPLNQEQIHQFNSASKENRSIQDCMEWYRSLQDHHVASSASAGTDVTGASTPAASASSGAAAAGLSQV
jgi:hypothetical protein